MVNGVMKNQLSNITSIISLFALTALIPVGAIAEYHKTSAVCDYDNATKNQNQLVIQFTFLARAGTSKVPFPKQIRYNLFIQDRSGKTTHVSPDVLRGTDDLDDRTADELLKQVTLRSSQPPFHLTLSQDVDAENKSTQTARATYHATVPGNLTGNLPAAETVETLKCKIIDTGLFTP
jgi:hypothetical protein